jgi:hypothetical protein
MNDEVTPCASSHNNEIMTDWHPLRSLEDTTSSAWTSQNEEAEARAKNAPQAKLPSLDHLKIKDFEDVYEPSDDTVRKEKTMHGDFTRFCVTNTVATFYPFV